MQYRFPVAVGPQMTIRGLFELVMLNLVQHLDIQILKQTRNDNQLVFCGKFGLLIKSSKICHRFFFTGWGTSSTNF